MSSMQVADLWWKLPSVLWRCCLGHQYWNFPAVQPFHLSTATIFWDLIQLGKNGGETKAGSSSNVLVEVNLLLRKYKYQFSFTFFEFFALNVHSRTLSLPANLPFLGNPKCRVRFPPVPTNTPMPAGFLCQSLYVAYKNMTSKDVIWH